MNSNKKKNNKADWLVPAALIMLSLVPVIAGAARVVELASGAEITAANARFFASPGPVLVHIISVTLYSLLGALQFTRNLRRPRSNWHRFIGKWILVPCGIAAALSGLWMARFYPWPDGDGELLYVFRLIFGSAMLLSIIVGFVLAVWRRDYKRHEDWMMRGYAIGLGAGTQVFTHLPWMLVFGAPNELTRALLMAAGWVINIIVAESIIRKRRNRRARKSLVYA
jgi:uncharacterized membrane protein